MAKATAANAELIAQKLSEVAHHLLEARHLMGEVEELVKKGEHEPEIKLPLLQDIKGAASVAARAASVEAGSWEGYARARGERH